MALPETVKIKLSSEEAGSISITPVLTQTLPLAELVELMLTSSGKDVARVHNLLRRGNLVSSASRYRWEPIEASEEEVSALLATFPDPDPERTFDAAACHKVIFDGPSVHVEISREFGLQKKLLRRHSFWEHLLDVIATGEMRYSTYSYRERADEYRLAVTADLLERVRNHAGLIAHSGTAAALSRAHVEVLSLYTARGGTSR